VLASRGLALTGTPAQIRTWNLSSLWRLPIAVGDAWLKVVPPFFAHEGRVLELLADDSVPQLLGHDGGRVLLAEVPGDDLYDAPLAQTLRMVTLLVALQRRFIERTAELLALGLPDWRGAPLQAAIDDVYRRNRAQLTATEAATLDRFVEDLPSRYAEIASCGIPDTLVHGDFHPGNLRGDGERLTLLDWGDSGVGHPLLDQAAFLDRIAKADVKAIRTHWYQQWREAWPGSDPARAATLLAPVAAARQAVIYQKFLDGIEPSEHPYHRDDPANWLRTAAGLLQ
jgi:Ser/Thr protein kinase RdoA (MazF antagonist)